MTILSIGLLVLVILTAIYSWSCVTPLLGNLQDFTMSKAERDKACGKLFRSVGLWQWSVSGCILLMPGTQDTGWIGAVPLDLMGLYMFAVLGRHPQLVTGWEKGD